jgi:hypothetical protein
MAWLKNGKTVPSNTSTGAIRSEGTGTYAWFRREYTPRREHSNGSRAMREKSDVLSSASDTRFPAKPPHA